MDHAHVAPDPAAAQVALGIFLGDRERLLAAIDGERRITVANFEPDQGAAIGEWLARQDARGAGIYFSPAETMPGLRKKAVKSDVVASEWVWIDVDPPKGAGDLETARATILARLRGATPAPTVIVDSGRGYWGYWHLQEATRDLDRLEAVNDALAQKLGGDACGNCDRIARLPGSVNRKGEPRLAQIVEHHPERVYTLADLGGVNGRAVAAAAIVPASGVDIAALDLSKLPEADRDKLLALIHHGPTPEHDYGGDRSRAVFAVACLMARAGASDDAIIGILLDPANGISAHVRDQGKPERYAARQVKRARKAVENDFATGDKGTPLPNQENIRLALAKAGVDVSHDTFSDRLLVAGLPGLGPTLDDAAMTRLWLMVDKEFKFRPGKEFFWDVVADAARTNEFHPVREYLAGLQWDGVGRVDKWLVTHGGAEDTPYTRAVGALLLVAAVRRVRQPGVKFDEMPVLESAQGQNKSSALAVLAVRPEWFSDDLPLNQDSQRVIERTAGRWIVEAAELKGMRGGGVEHLKAFLSRQIDRARMAYGRLPVEVPRQFVIIGTTNSDSYLRDGTGNRRFWPVPVGRFDLDTLRRDRDQLWAEAASREAAGESIRLNPSLWDAAAEQQEARRIEDPFEATLRERLGDLRGKVKGGDLMVLLGVPEGARNQEHNVRLGAAMQQLGWTRTKARFGGAGPENCYAKGETHERQRRLIVRRHADGGVDVVLEGVPAQGEGVPREERELPL